MFGFGYKCPKCGANSEQKGLDILENKHEGNTHIVLCKKCNSKYEFKYEIDRS